MLTNALVIEHLRKHSYYVSGRTLLLLKSAYLAALIYRGMLYKPKEHLHYTKNKLFESPGFRRIISQNKMALLQIFFTFC